MTVKSYIATLKDGFDKAAFQSVEQRLRATLTSPESLVNYTLIPELGIIGFDGTPEEASTVRSWNEIIECREDKDMHAINKPKLP